LRRIGITGGIGAGKSLVCTLFELLGIPNYPADARAKYLQTHDHELKSNILKLFGEEAYLPGNRLNRAFISKAVFSNTEKLQQLNQLVHPAVAKDFEKWCQQYAEKPFVLKEAALLFESGSYKQLDATILVHAPETLRLERTLLRDEHRNEEEVRNIMANQMDEKEKLQLADYVIYNDESVSLIKQCVDLQRLYNNS